MRNMLTLTDREEIPRGLAKGLLYKEIARLIDRNPSGGLSGRGPSRRPCAVPGHDRRRDGRRRPAAAEGVRARPFATATNRGQGATLAMVAPEINDRPRKIDNWKKPSEISLNSSRKMLPLPESAALLRYGAAFLLLL